MSFASDVAAWAAKSKANASLAHKKIATDLFTRIIQRTPVDTGRLRGNWQSGYGEFIEVPIDREDPDGAGTIAAMVSTVLQAPPGIFVTLTNNLPYARRIEYDNWSKQAPEGMVRISVAEFQGIVDAVIQELT